MFYCAPCAKKNEWPGNFITPQSRGPCEVCGKVAVCFDVPSRALPLAKRERCGPNAQSQDKP